VSTVAVLEDLPHPPIDSPPRDPDRGTPPEEPEHPRTPLGEPDLGRTEPDDAMGA
jgi:hypothetical protein